MKKVLITGANGFLGTALCKELLSRCDCIYVVVKEGTELSSAFLENSKINVIPCSMANYEKLPNLILERDFDVLYHLAWVGTAGPLRSDYKVQLENVKCACDIVKVCKEISCKRIVFSASIMEYEIQSVMDHGLEPGISTLYSTAKLTADYMMKTIAAKEGIEYIRAVISNIYGPGEISPRLVNTSLRKMISGEHCSFSAGEQMYDFIYITDAAISFAELGEKGLPNKTYYIGSQNPKPLKEFLIEMRDIVNPEIELGLGEIPFNGISLTYMEFDVNAVKRDTGFEPKISFSEGIKRTIDWLRSEG